MVLDKTKEKTVAVDVENFFELKPKMYSFFVENSSKGKKTKGVNRNVVAPVRHNEYKYVLLNNKCMKHSINRIQSRDQKIGTVLFLTLGY